MTYVYILQTYLSLYRFTFIITYFVLFLYPNVFKIFVSGPIKEDSNFKDNDPSVDYVDIIGTEEQLVSILQLLNDNINNNTFHYY